MREIRRLKRQLLALSGRSNDSVCLGLDKTVLDPTDRITCLSRLIRLGGEGPNQEVRDPIY